MGQQDHDFQGVSHANNNNANATITLQLEQMLQTLAKQNAELAKLSSEVASVKDAQAKASVAAPTVAPVAAPATAPVAVAVPWYKTKPAVFSYGVATTILGVLALRHKGATEVAPIDTDMTVR